MLRSQTADRIVAGNLLNTNMRLRGGNENLRNILSDRTCPVVLADNIAEYVNRQAHQGRDYRIGEWPCLAPPWDQVFIEYPSSSGRQRRGIYMLGFDLDRATPDELAELNGLVGEAIKDSEVQSPGQKVRWALVLVLFVDDGRRVTGPMGSIIWALDKYGKELGNRWFLNSSFKWAEADQEEAMWMHAAVLPALQTIAFCHTKNAVIDQHQAPERLAKAYRRRHGQEPLRWQTIRLELPRSPSEGGQSSGNGIAPSLHIVTGAFHHYGNCCPSTHPAKGLLFGRLEGVFWVPSHFRGSKDQGEVRSDKVVTLRGEHG